MEATNSMDLYNNYYWQNEKVRLRLWHPKDSEYDAVDSLDTAALSLVHEEVVLPSADLLHRHADSQGLQK